MQDALAFAEFIPDLRAHHDDGNLSSNGGGGTPGQQNPDCNRFAPFHPPNRKQKTDTAGESTYLGNRSWNCAFN
jgi:hypothetical protein